MLREAYAELSPNSRTLFFMLLPMLISGGFSDVLIDNGDEGFVVGFILAMTLGMEQALEL